MIQYPPLVERFWGSWGDTIQYRGVQSTLLALGWGRLHINGLAPTKCGTESTEYA